MQISEPVDYNTLFFCRFPVELGSVISLLQPLAMDQYSAHKLHSLLCRVSWYAESASSHGLEGCVQAGDQEGTVVLTRGKELYKQGTCKFWSKHARCMDIGASLSESIYPYSIEQESLKYRKPCTDC